jgi:phospholipase C
LFFVQKCKTFLHSYFLKSIFNTINLFETATAMKKIYVLACLAALAALPAFTYKKAGTPRPDHIIIVIEENHGFNEVIGSANAPFITELANEGALFTESHGITHPSQPNYLALFSGSTQGVTDDACLVPVTPYKTPNMGAALINSGFTFKGYAQTMPSAGYLDCLYLKSDITQGYLYARKHAPWVNWIGTGPNSIPASLSRPMTDFPKDFSTLPNVSFVIPDMDCDMHNVAAGDEAAIQKGDKWLKDNLGAYVKWAKTHNSLLIVTFDEDDYKTQNQIPTIFSGSMVKPGKYSQSINHYSVLHTIEDMYGLPVIDTTRAAVITGIWK